MNPSRKSLLNSWLPLAAFLTLAIAFTVALDKQNDATFKKRAGIVYNICVRNNEFRKQVNYQFDLFVIHNNAAVVLFEQVGRDLKEGSDNPRFQTLGERFTDASIGYRELSKKYKNVPLENCDAIKTP